MQIVLKDSQQPNRAGEVANDDPETEVALVLTAGTPETANPVSDACELNEVPCISSVVPWQPWFFGRKGDPAKGCRVDVPRLLGPGRRHRHLHQRLEEACDRRAVGGLFPNDADGNAWATRRSAFPSRWPRMGFTLTDPGRFQIGTQDFSAQIAAFKSAASRS